MWGCLEPMGHYSTGQASAQFQLSPPADSQVIAPRHRLRPNLVLSQVHVERRLAEIHDRYGSGHLVSRSISRATPLILEAVGQVSARTARAS